MNRSEVVDLMIEIKQNYPNFDVSDESINRHFKYLHDFPFDAAMQNVEGHVRTERFPPLIADIRGRIGEQIERQREKEETEAYFAQLELWRINASPPPEGMRERIMSLLRGDSA